MIFTFSQQQIDAIKLLTFPDMNPTNNIVDLKNCVLNTSGTDSVFKLNIIIKDELTENADKKLVHGKIFNNKISQKMMKMIFFEMYDEQIRTKALQCNTSLELLALIRNYGVIHYILSPSYDFDGHKTDPDKHFKEQNTNIINLSYKKDFILPETDINYFSLGIAIFNDLDIYVKEQNIKPEFIEKRILFGGVKIFDLIKTDYLNPIVNDLRLVKTIFKNVNSNSQFSYSEDMASTGLSLLENINSDTSLDKKIIKLLSEKQKKIANDVYFSNAYYSRNRDGKLSFIFNLDYKNLLINNTSYQQFIKNSSMQDEFLNSVNLSSLSIVRRRITKSTKKDKPKIYNNNSTLTTIITANDNKQTKKIEHKKEKSFSIKENSLWFIDEVGNLRTFEITDAEVYDLGAGLYQYGVQITLEDTFFDKILQKIGESRIDIKNLNDYYSLANKILKIDSKDITAVVKQGVYDPITNSFTKEFIKDYVKELTSVDNNGQTKQYSLSSLNIEAVARFVSLLELFGIKLPAVNDKETIANIFISMLNPETGNPDTILTFINTYQKFINKMEKIFSSINKNKLIFIDNWFNNDFVDTSHKIGIGYQYVQNEDSDGLGTVSLVQLNSIIEKEILKYTPINQPKDSEIPNKFGFISPSVIYTDNRSINLDLVVEDVKAISQFNFIEAEIDIKRFNLLDKAGNKVTVDNRPNNPSPRQQELTLRMNNVMESLSVKVSDLFVNSANASGVNTGNDNLARYNNKLDASYLLLALAKNINFSNNKLKQAFEQQKPFINGRDAKNIYKDEYENLVPMQVRYLADNSSRILNQNQEYLKSLDFNSLFLFFYNTLHCIEYLYLSTDTNKNILLKSENWAKLDGSIINWMEENNLTVLCRIKNYQDNLLGINEWEQIKLPIYNQYFLLSAKPSSFSVSPFRPRTFDKFSTNIRSIIESTNLVNLAKSTQPPPTAPPPTNFTNSQRITKQTTQLNNSLTTETDALRSTVSNTQQAPPRSPATSQQTGFNSSSVSMQNGNIMQPKKGVPPFIDRMNGKLGK